MKNPRITPKDRGLIKGAIRKAFSRSDLRNRVIAKCLLPDHVDTTRPRVKNWGRCNICKNPTPKSYLAVDHIIPVVPIHTTFADMSLDEFIDLVWCNEEHLQAVCETCHDEKTAKEKLERKALAPKKPKKQKVKNVKENR